MTKGELIGTGRIAEVFAWGNDQVLKLYRPEFPPEEADYEARIGHLVHEAGLDAPAVGDGVNDVVEVDGRRGILYERVDGPTMLQAVTQRPWTLWRAARQLAELQARMHSRTCPALPSQEEALRRTISNVPQLPPDLKARILVRLERLSDSAEASDAICHGDYHPDNVIMAAHGPVVIDWVTAKRGCPLADAARTSLLFQTGTLPPDLGPLQHLVLETFRYTFHTVTMRHYCRLRGVAQEDIDAWLPVMAAARLAERIPGEETRLLAMIKAQPHPPTPSLGL